MSLKRRAPKNDSKASEVVFENLENGGEYEARLVYVGDLGMQERSYGKEVKTPAQQISLGLEILGETVEIDGVEAPRLLWTNPANIFWQLTELGKELELYKVFNPKALPDTEADWDAQLGKPCNVTIKHVKGKGQHDGKVFDNIASIGAIPTKYQKNVVEGTMTPCVGDADDEENPATKALYGLSRFVWDKRLPEEVEETEVGEDDFDDENDVPF